jgi:chromosome partitioning protein
MARIIAVSNQKGGVGKTTTSVNLSAALAHRGYQVLMVDLDPQGNASSGVGFPRDAVDLGTYELLTGEQAAAACVTTTLIKGLDVLLSSRALVGAEVELVGMADRERRLRKGLQALRRGYDFIILDCPPSLGLLTLNALTAADSVLIPLQAEYYAMEGLSELLRTIAVVRRRMNPDLHREGVVITMSDARNNLCKDVEIETREILGDEVFSTVIPRNVRLGEAPSFGIPIVEYDRRSAGASAYFALADELLQRNGMNDSLMAVSEAS